MTGFINDYVAFINRPFQDTEITGIQVFPEFYKLIALYTLGFSALYLCVPFLLRNVWPKWYTALDPIKRKEMPTYLISFVHHFVVVPIGWLHIYQDYVMWTSDVQPGSDFYVQGETSMIVLGCAFLLADILFCALGDAFSGKPLYLFHHALIITLGVSVVRGVPGSYMRLVPHFLICETTNIFFNMAWVLRAAGWRGNAVVLTFEYLFALSFFPIRIINLSLVIWVLQTKGASLGLAKYTLHPIGAMQYFWCYKILSMIHSRYGPQGSGTSSPEIPIAESVKKNKKRA